MLASHPSAPPSPPASNNSDTRSDNGSQSDALSDDGSLCAEEQTLTVDPDFPCDLGLEAASKSRVPPVPRQELLQRDVVAFWFVGLHSLPNVMRRERM